MTDGAVHWRVRDTRCRYEVGDIIAKTTTPKSYEYLLPCDGSAFDTNKYPMLAKVFTTGKVPNLTDGRFLEGSTSAGTSKDAGLPDIKGEIGDSNGEKIGLFWGLFGAFYSNKSNRIRPTFGADSTVTSASGETFFAASKSNAIYGSSDTVQPKSFTVMYYVCYGG